MTWELALIIGLGVGLLLGILITRLGGNKNAQQQETLKELEKSKAELAQYKDDLMTHFVRTAEILENVADTYRQLRQHMSDSSTTLLPEITEKLNTNLHQLAGEQSTDLLIDTTEETSEEHKPPKDYSGNASGLLRPESRDQ